MSEGDRFAMIGLEPPLDATVVSLFCGAGGLDLGFKRAGFKALAAIDNNRDCCDTYSANLGLRATCGDLATLDLEWLPQCDVVIGGCPCQGFSVAGKMDPDDPRGRLVWKFVEVVRRLNPRAFVMENVKALAALSRWENVRTRLLGLFSGLGYTVDMRVLNAKFYGVPQSRERVFFIGTRGLGRVPDARTSDSPPKTARQVLLSLPPPGTPPNLGVCKAKVTAAAKPVLRASPYAGMMFNGGGRPINLDSVVNTLPASMGGNRTPIVDEEELRGNKENWFKWYHGWLGSGQPVARSLPHTLRRLSVTEAALFQGFPIEFRFWGSQSSQYRQIGNSVPPPLAEAVATALAEALSQDLR